jgi:hypothetical protein
LSDVTRIARRRIERTELSIESREEQSESRVTFSVESFALVIGSAKSPLIATGRGALEREPRRRRGASSSPTKTNEGESRSASASATFEMIRRPDNDAQPEFSSLLPRCIFLPSIVGSKFDALLDK